MELKRLEPEELKYWGEAIRPLLEHACEQSNGRYRTSDILRFALNSEWQIWLALEDGKIAGICGTEVIVFPTGLKALAFRFCTGEGREQWEHFVGDMLSWGKSRGCDLSEGIFRKGWGRVLPGWTHRHDFLERAL